MVAGDHNYIPPFFPEQLLLMTKPYNLTKTSRTIPNWAELFPETPCEDCIEVIGKRTETGKYFIKKGTEGKYIYQQSSTDAVHYMDTLGRWRTIYTKQP